VAQPQRARGARAAERVADAHLFVLSIPLLETKPEPAMDNPYVSDLASSRQCNGDERNVVSIGDSGQKGTDVYWCRTVGRWICVSLDSLPHMMMTEDVALVRLHEDANPEDGLSQVALACDCEREKGLWLIEGVDLEELADRYGAALETLWCSKAEDRATTLSHHVAASAS